MAQEGNVKVGIGIITYNGATRVASLLKSIVRCTSMDDVDVYVVDDGSKRRQQKLLRGVCEFYGVKVSLHSENLGISSAWNHCIARLHERGIYVLANDDVQVRTGWLDALTYFLARNKQVGMVGLHQRHQGTIRVPEACDPSMPYKRLSSSGYCFAFTGQTWGRIGKFDEGFLSFYEELDFGVRCLKAGLANYDIGPAVDHLWGQTFRENADDLLPKVKMGMSRKRFERKHGAIGALEALMRETGPKSLAWLGEDGEDKTGEVPTYWQWQCQLPSPEGDGLQVRRQEACPRSAD